MRASFLVALLAVAGLISGCDTAMRHRISAHEDAWQRLPEKTQLRLRHQVVRPGDTEAMVKIALGPPDKVVTQAAPNGRKEAVWQYTIFEGPDTSDPEPRTFRGYMTVRTKSLTFRDGLLTQIKTTPAAATAPRMAAAPQGRVTTQEALQWAKSVILIRRVLERGQIHAYVKEVWRFDPAAGPAPAIGTEYGQPTPYWPAVQNPERDGIVFEFGVQRPHGLPRAWRITVGDDGTVPLFLTDVSGLRRAVETTKPKA